MGLFPIDTNQVDLYGLRMMSTQRETDSAGKPSSQSSHKRFIARIASAQTAWENEGLTARDAQCIRAKIALSQRGEKPQLCSDFSEGGET